MPNAFPGQGAPQPTPPHPQTMRTLAQEYRESVGKGDEEEEAGSFLAAKPGGDRAAAREVWEALHRAGLGGRSIPLTYPKPFLSR